MQFKQALLPTQQYQTKKYKDVQILNSKIQIVTNMKRKLNMKFYQYEKLKNSQYTNFD